MNRARAVFNSFGLAHLFLSTRFSSINRPICSQVTQFSRYFHSTSNQHRHYSSLLINTYPKIFSCSKPQSVVELVLGKDWCTELENELENFNQEWTHGTVIYVLRNLDKDPQKASDFFFWVCENIGFKPNFLIYKLVLRILARKELMKRFWIVLMRMKIAGLYIDEETYSEILLQLRKKNLASDVAFLTQFYNSTTQENAMDGVVKKFVNIIRGSKWSYRVERQLEELNIVYSDSIVVMVLKELRKYPLKVGRFFRWVAQFPGYKHNSVTYSAFAWTLARPDKHKEFWKVIEEMKGMGHEMDIDSYRKISKQFLKHKMMVDAVKLFEYVMDGPYEPSANDCCRLLRTISVSYNPDLNLVYRVLKKLENTEATVSKTIYDWIHRSLASAGRFDEAERIVNVMSNSGFAPDNITYSQVVFGLCKAKRLEEASKMLVEMEESGCTPDNKTWTILIQGHCVAGEIDKALVWLSKMMEKHLNVDADLLNVLIDGFLSQRKIEAAYTFLIKMMDKLGLRPLQVTYRKLIEKLLQVRRFEEALCLLRLMKRDYQPYPDPFSDYIAKFGTVEDAVQFLKALTLKDYPSPSAFAHVFRSLHREGKHSEANDLLCKCPHHIQQDFEICRIFGTIHRKAAVLEQCADGLNL
ncbi:pentatricopeptide repeat-containing protein At3g48250, chloroplastic [Cannabis sativa]|uniref:pentatricopeptide repeat-containing protein At3g48250, chloroplastic n=1 Tax=Cannabis sativa TaxID=3483 RepID=UPI0029CA3C32|nr:pentatricopeptide repeat-containing protein At3g48250, chloroplastic [Cannabis sativa]XP_030495819.2 pentatricopeptide repeat-containing protein At3g48250, chloroplastic [Cannabis sativa]